MTNYRCQHDVRQFLVQRSYGIATVVHLWIDTCTGSAVGSHRLIPVLSEVEVLRFLAVMRALDDFRTDEGALCDDPLQRDHVVQVYRAESSGIARKFAEAAGEGTVVHLADCQSRNRNILIGTDRILMRLLRWSVR